MATFGVKDIRERYGVGAHTVIAWIKSGELKAINIARRPGGKPKWRITEEALAAFESLRTPTPPALAVRRKRQPADIIDRY